MSNPTTNTKEQIAARLGLHAAPAASGAVGQPPTAEDFGALYEGSLDATRRAQVLSHITTDRAIYRRWLEVVEGQASLDPQLSATDQVAATHSRPSLLSRLSRWMRESLWVPAGAGSVAAAALVVVMLLPSNEQGPAPGAWDDVDTIYSEFGNQWNRAPGTLSDRRVRGAKTPSAPTAEQQALYEGMRDGLAALDDTLPQMWLPELAVDPAQVQALPEALHDTLRAAGRLATLARFQCQLDGTTAFFDQAAVSMDKLGGALREQGLSRTSQDLVKTIEQPGESADRVCEFAAAAVANLRAVR